MYVGEWMVGWVRLQNIRAPPAARTSGREGVRAGPGTIIRDKILMKWVAINAPELPGPGFCTEFRAGSF